MGESQQKEMDTLTEVPTADAASLLALLNEQDPELVSEALRGLDAIVPQSWPEISEALPTLEQLSEDPKFAAAQLASLVVSKVYFHLGRQEDALDYALLAGEHFNPIDRTPNTDVAYADSMLRNCVDHYVKVRVEEAEASSRAQSSSSAAAAVAESLTGVVEAMGTVQKLDPRLVAIVERLISDSVARKDFSLALGLAVDSRRFDLVERIVDDEMSHSDVALECCRHLALDEVSRDALLPRSAKMELLRILVRAFRQRHGKALLEDNTKYVFQLVDCLTILEDSEAVAGILRELIHDCHDRNCTRVLTAYQIAFDLCSSAPQSFLNTLMERLQTTKATDAAAPAAGAEDFENETLKKLCSILSGEILVDKDIDFLFHHNHTDIYLLNTIKATVDAKSSITHTATVYANSLMHAGTAVDTFVRENLSFICRANHWAKFAATAGFGVIHKGRHQRSLQILSNYLPARDGANARRGSGGNSSPSPYNEGGALYGLGFIHANHGGDIVQYLMDSMSDPNGNEVVLHGACLGLGIAAMGTDNMNFYEQLKTVMYAQQNGAVAGEAAGLAMGLVHMGTMTPHITEMLAYAHQTSHERVCRGLVLGIAIAMLGRQEEADTMIEQLTGDKDPVIRYGGAFAVALAYCGTGSTQATRKLLHIAVTDVSDDVRRAALTGLGFILFKQPHQCPPLVQLLMDSFNPHVRYGAAMALGIACAGTALSSAIDLLEPLTRDPVDFVRQGAMIALGLVLVEATAAEEPRLESFTKNCLERIENKNEAVLSKIGAILAQGLVNASGRNVVISCATLNGNTNMRAVVGLAVFCQYWFWQPYILFACLSMTPTSVLALDSDLKQVPLKFKSNVQPSMFAYPPGMKPPEKSTAAKGPSAVLSYGHGKAHAKPKPATAAAAAAAAATPAEKPAEEATKKAKPTKEPSFEVLTSPCRVTLRQRKHLTFDVDERYSPVKSGIVHGITLVRDNQPPAPIECDASAESAAAAPAATATAAAAAGGAEGEARDDCPKPPAPFELPM